MDGILLIDKPKGWTSAQVVSKIKYLTRANKVGHAGTLDPQATGVLVVLLGSATKKANEFLLGIKEYEGEITLGATSNTGDQDGIITPNPANLRHPEQNEIQDALNAFLGESLQVPPMFSAKKIAGKKLYELARQGKTVEREAKRIVIYEVALIEYSYPRIVFRVRCSKGTYVRQIAVDLGERLKTGGYLSALRRTFSEPFSIKETMTMEKMAELAHSQQLVSFLVQK